MLPWRTYLTAVPLLMCSHAAMAQGQDANAVAPGVNVAADAKPAAKADPKAPVAASAGTELTWLGHAAWMLRSPAGTTVLIDPWLDNPRKPADFVLPERIDAILLTHGHPDHVGEAVALSESHHAPVVAAFELIEQLGLKDGIGANIGGTVTIKDMQVHVTQAVHSSGVVTHGHLPPPPVADAAPPCKCPPDHACGNHGDPGTSQGAAAEAAKPDGHQALGHAHHPHELVVGDSDNDSTMGPAEKAVAHAQAQARGDASSKGRHKGHGHAGHTHGDAAMGSAEAKASGDKPDSCHCPHHMAAAGAGAAAAAADAQAQGPHLAYAGSAMGFVIEVERGPTVYHAGDTDLFLDMGLIKRRYAPEVALLPIGGHYTMGPKDAALAASMLDVKDVVPMHYGTSPLLTGTAAELRTAVADQSRVISPRPGAKITYATRR